MVHITFLHPDLGIGGAERLVVDAALALKKKGHQVDFVTTHHSPDHCFTETKDGTLEVTVVGDWLPRHVFGKFFALFAYIRMIYAALYIIFRSECADVVFVDLVSICIPFLKFRIPTVVFYCHFPDQLLTSYQNKLKSLYRIPLNYLEEITTGKADKIFINSLFTQEVFKATFSRLTSIDTQVLYPAINVNFADKGQILPLNRIFENQEFPPDRIILLSINRFERKKQLTLAIVALAELKKHLSMEAFNKVFLVIAGGYDKRVEENVEYFNELSEKADELGVTDKVLFLRSFTDNVKTSLLKHCDILIYTPPNEHFGIVPIEAMCAEKPVVAHNSGGPRETILNNVSGYLVESEYFADRIARLILNGDLRLKFGKAGRKRVIEKFSFDAFSNELDKSLLDLLNKKMK